MATVPDPPQWDASVVGFHLVPLIERAPPAGYTLLLPHAVTNALDAPTSAALDGVYELVAMSSPEAASRRDRTLAMLSGLDDVPAADLARVGLLLDLPGHWYGEHWQGYTLDAAGIVLWPPPPPNSLAERGSLRPGRPTPPRPSYDFPYWQPTLFRRDPAGATAEGSAEGSLVLQIWHRVLRYQDSPLTLEGRWNRAAGERRSIYGLEHLPPGQLRAATNRLLAGLPFFQQVATGGRPMGTGTFDSAAEFSTVMVEAIRAVRDARRRPTQANVAAYLTGSADPNHPECTVEQIKQWCRRDFRIPWEQLVAQAGMHP